MRSSTVNLTTREFAQEEAGKRGSKWRNVTDVRYGTVCMVRTLSQSHPILPLRVMRGLYTLENLLGQCHSWNHSRGSLVNGPENDCLGQYKPLGIMHRERSHRKNVRDDTTVGQICLWNDGTSGTGLLMGRQSQEPSYDCGSINVSQGLFFGIPGKIHTGTGVSEPVSDGAIC